MNYFRITATINDSFKMASCHRMYQVYFRGDPLKIIMRNSFSFHSNSLEEALTSIKYNQLTQIEVVEMEETKNKYQPFIKVKETLMRKYIPGENLDDISVANGHFPSKGDRIAYDPKNPEDKWVITEKFFGENYESVKQDFSTALRKLKEGKRAARSGWNEKGMYLYYVPANSYPTQTPSAKDEFGEMVPYGAYIAMKTAQGNVVPWLASQTDLTAEDWEVLK